MSSKQKLAAAVLATLLAACAPAALPVFPSLTPPATSQPTATQVASATRVATPTSSPVPENTPTSLPSPTPDITQYTDEQLLEQAEGFIANGELRDYQPVAVFRGGSFAYSEISHDLNYVVLRNDYSDRPIKFLRLSDGVALDGMYGTYIGPNGEAGLTLSMVNDESIVQLH